MNLAGTRGIGWTRSLVARPRAAATATGSPFRLPRLVGSAATYTARKLAAQPQFPVGAATRYRGEAARVVGHEVRGGVVIVVGDRRLVVSPFRLGVTWRGHPSLRELFHARPPVVPLPGARCSCGRVKRCLRHRNLCRVAGCAEVEAVEKSGRCALHYVGCRLAGCEKRAVARRLCQNHFKSLQRYGNARQVERNRRDRQRAVRARDAKIERRRNEQRKERALAALRRARWRAERLARVDRSEWYPGCGVTRPRRSSPYHGQRTRIIYEAIVAITAETGSGRISEDDLVAFTGYAGTSWREIGALIAAGLITRKRVGGRRFFVNEYTVVKPYRAVHPTPRRRK